MLTVLYQILPYKERGFGQFCAIDGAVDMIIDVLVRTEEKDNDVKNAMWYNEQRGLVANMLWRISSSIWEQLKSRDIVGLLVDHLKRASATKFSRPSFKILKCFILKLQT